MRIAEALRKCIEEREWSAYRLAKESGVPESTVRAALSGETEPTFRTAEALCRGLRIPFAALLAEGATPQLSEEESVLLFQWNCLRREDRELVYALVQSLAEKGR